MYTTWQRVTLTTFQANRKSHSDLQKKAINIQVRENL